MNRPPRRPGKRLLGKLVMWRCVFVCVLLVCLVLGMYYWSESEGKSLDLCRWAQWAGRLDQGGGLCEGLREGPS